MGNAKKNSTEVSQHKNNGMRIAKYETFIEDINKAIKNEARNNRTGRSGSLMQAITSANALTFGTLQAIGRDANYTNGGMKTPLDLIFKRDEVNEYAQIIMDKAMIRLRADNSISDPWQKGYGFSSLDDDKEKISAFKDFVGYCKDGRNSDVGYILIFWSLMVLSVDDTDADDKLSLICDIAKMLKITDDELMDIAYVVKSVYNEVEDEYTFKTSTVKEVFGKVISLYN